jgi:signal peptidase II
MQSTKTHVHQRLGEAEVGGFIVLYLVAFVVFALDQGIKWLVVHHMAETQMIAVVPPVLYWDYIRNPGGAFGILPNARWVLILIAVVVISSVIWVHLRYRPRLWTRMAMALLLGGALGNLADRVLSGTVVDYVYLKIINFPVFNLADVAIDAGVAMLLLNTLRANDGTKGSTKDVETS